MRPPADLMVVNARPWSGVARADADAVAVAGDRIAAVGRARDLEGLQGPRTRVLDAAGGTVTPGMTDAHLHVLDWARAAAELDLAGAASRAEVLIRVSRFVSTAPAGGPVVGRGFDRDRFEQPPERRALDAVSGDRPVILHAKDFHGAWVNSAALAAAGVTRATPDPAGGWIERDAAGEPTGFLAEHAVALVAALATRSPDDDARLLEAAVARLHAFGITAIHDFEGAAAARRLRALARGPEPRLRVLMHLPHRDLEHALALGLESGVGDDAFRIGALKLFADGTLGSRTASMLEPYDGTAERGHDLIPPAELAAIVRRAAAAGLSVAIHAIGDRAVRSALDAFAGARELLPALSLPPRIEHAQLVDPADLPRFAALGVAASVQPVHAVADAELAERWWSGRLATSYPWRSLRDAGALVAFGSDAPVEAPSVAAGLAAAVSRRPAGRAHPFVPAQLVTLDEALDAYTRGPALLAGAGSRLGTLAPGAAADLVVWDRDLHALAPEELERAAPAATVLAGRIVHRAAGLPEAAPSGRGAAPRVGA